MKIEIIKKAYISGQPYDVGSIVVVKKVTAEILIRKGKAMEIEDKPKTANSNKED